MIRILGKCRNCIILAVMALLAVNAEAEIIERGKVKIQYEPLADGGIKVINVWNNSDKRISLIVDGEIKTINANSSAQPNLYASRIVRFDYATSSGAKLWEPTARKEEVPAPTAQPNAAVEKAAENVVEETVPERKEGKEVSPKTERILKKDTPATTESFDFVSQLNNDPFFNQESIRRYSQRVNTLCAGLEAAKDKPQFILDHDVDLFLEQSKSELDQKRADIPQIAKQLVVNAKVDEANQTYTVSLIVDALTSRLKTREDAYEKLNTLVARYENTDTVPTYLTKENLINYGIVGTIILLVLILAIVSIRKKSKKKKVSGSHPAVSNGAHQPEGDNPAIVVRRKTTSILKKQCIDDVVDNPAYMVINTSDFTPDSAVRKIYIKNSCIKDVYNLYAEDLRNSENPKEDGCMVLGRWVYDEARHTYDISLEDVVFPGDDAVFKEYELNFGGKIKLRIVERLRKLRRDTNLQYDLVCWIHSHPGLGVFFSNSDDNVQMQLKHSQHPNFLVAFVVDILTSDQEMGIFTFRRDGSMNSKGDITKMYSLEEMYKWALQSERQSFIPDSYFNVLKDAKLKMSACNGVEMNNSSIIDLTQIVIEPETGIVGWAIGTTIEDKSGMEFVVSNIARDSEKPKTGVIGCLINEAHMSLPTIQRLVAHDSVNLSFVMVYSSKQMSLTTIPVINGELLTDERFYGDVNIDDLKIWTRRKR